MTNETNLHRQVNPVWIQCGRITSQIFHPTPKDQSLLSVYDGDLITPRKSWEHFCHVLHYSSVGVLSVTVGECQAEHLTAKPDPIPFPEHAVIDFSGFSGNEVKRKAKYLKAAAETRGWQYQVEL